MATIPQRELRNNVSEVLRRAESGERLTITVNGRAVAELGPVPSPRASGQRLGTAEDLREIRALAAKDPTFLRDVLRMREEDRENAVDIWGGDVSFLVDTSALVSFGIEEDIDEWAVSVVTVGELRAGVLIAQEPELRALRLAILEAVVARADAVAVDRQVASAYAEIRAVTGRKPSNDLWIAATAKAHDLELVTADRRMATTPGVRTLLVG